jgi:hypothetical protein
MSARFDKERNNAHTQIMHVFEIHRLPAESSPKWGTFGECALDGFFFSHSIERPWVDNEHGTSCIPEGTYIAKPEFSPKHGCILYKLQDVPGRTDIEIHPANFAYQLLGCIALGKEITMIEDPHDQIAKKGVTSSGSTIGRFMAELDGSPELKVIISQKG